jgi:hypothetical protein
MPGLKTYGLFLSHAWKNDSDYSELVKMLESYDSFEFKNYSELDCGSPVDPDEAAQKNKLISMLDEQIRGAGCVLILSGMYGADSYWISKEIKIAKAYNKPVIAVKSREHGKVPKAIQDDAVKVVAWDAESIVDAVKMHSV